VEIDILEKDDTHLRFLVQGADIPYMNALRRLSLSEVPCMAVDDVVILENSSVLQDEIIAHRLGFVPLKTDLDSYNLPEECPCKSEFGCNLCRVTLAIDVEAKDGPRTVYSGDLTSGNPTIKPVSDKIPILKLAKNQRIKLEAYARLGKGKAHAKWQPVSMCTYKYYPKIRISKTCDVCGECVDICPRKVLAKKGGKVEVQDLVSCTLCHDCAEACPKEPSAIEVTAEENKFIFNVESTEALPPQRIVEESLKILDKQLKELEAEIKVKKSEKI
jgi:DNA-directed RNA polymerase subunit D